MVHAFIQFIGYRGSLVVLAEYLEKSWFNDGQRASSSTFCDAHACPPRTRLKSQTRATRLKKRLTPCQSFESLIYRRDTIEGAPFFVQSWTTTPAARRWSGRSTTFGAINKIRFTCCASYRRDMKTRVTCIQWYVVARRARVDVSIGCDRLTLSSLSFTS